MVDPPVGARLGRYRVSERIGTGGMGAVYRAHDTVLERKVAIKLMRAGMEEGRLLREGQALARLQHPNVVEIFDVGRCEFGLFVAMELVHGANLGDWITEHRPERAALLRLFLRAGRGLAAGHALRIVHRDFKPSNVMVDDERRVRVLDFGLVRLAEGGPDTTASPDPAPDDAPAAMDLLSTCLTADGVVLGTPLYMAPEQHVGRPATEVSDQYAFCLSLAEALLGHHPFRGASLLEIAEKKRRSWTELTFGDAALTRALRRGLDPDPDRRWPDMPTLLAELERIRKPRRTRRLVAWGGFAALVAGTAFFGMRSEESICLDADGLDPIWNDARADELRHVFSGLAPRVGEATWTTTAERIDAWAEEWARAYQRSCEQAQAGPGQDRLDQRMACLRRQADSLQALLEAFADPSRAGMTRAPAAADGLPTPADCLADEEELLQRAAEEEPVLAQLRRANALFDAGRPQRGMEVAEEALAAARALDSRTLIVDGLMQRGVIARALGDTKRAASDYNDAYFSESVDGDPARAGRIAARLAFLHANRGDAEATRRWAQYARAAIERAPKLAWLEASLYNAEAQLARRQGDYAAALEAYDAARVVFERDPGRLGPLDRVRLESSSAEVLSELGRTEEAVTRLRDAVRRVEEEGGPFHPTLASTQQSLGIALWYRGDLDEATRLLAQTHDLTEAIFGADHPRTHRAIANRAGALIDAGDSAQALELYERLTRGSQESPRRSGNDFARYLGGRARALARLGRVPEAIETYQRALVIRREAVPDDHPTVGITLYNLGMTELRAGQLDAALTHLREAEAILRPPAGEVSVRAVIAKAGLSRALAASSNLEEAQRLLEQATEMATAAELDDAERIDLDLARAHVATARGVDTTELRGAIRAHALALGPRGTHLLETLDRLPAP